MTAGLFLLAAGSLLVVFGCGPGVSERLDEAARLARGEGGAEAGPRLQQLAADGEPRVRAIAVAGLARIAPREGRNEVLEALDDTDARVRAVGARAAGELRIREAAWKLSGLARSDASEDVRRQAVAALQNLPGELSDESLAAAADDPVATIRLAAIRGLSAAGARMAAASLAMRALGDVSWEVRAASLEALSRTEDFSAWVPVEAGTYDRNEFVRAAAFRAADRLSAAGVPRSEPEPKPSPQEAPRKAAGVPEGRDDEPVYTPPPDPDADGSQEEPPDSP